MKEVFSQFAQKASIALGHYWSFIGAALLIIIWGATGPIFKYSDTWQLFINTGTTIITFLMVFLIQATQNRDSLAIQTKLDELIKSSQARNAFIGIDKLSEDELIKLRNLFS